MPTPHAIFDPAVLTVGNGNPVPTDPDQSGNGNDFTQSDSSKQGIFQSTGLDGKPAISFDGVNDGMTSSIAPGSALTVIVAYGKRASSGTWRLLSGSNNWLIGHYTNTFNGFNGSFINPLADSDPGFSDKETFIVTFQQDGTGASIRVDGSLQTFYTATAGAGTLPGTIKIGSEGFGSNAPNCKRGKLEIYNSVLSAGSAAARRVLMLDYYGLVPTTRLSFTGNSLSYGTGSTNPGAFPNGTDWPSLLLAAITKPTWTSENLAAAGATSANITSGQLPTVVAGVRYLRLKHVAFVWELTNDLNSGGKTAQQAHDAVQTICQTLTDDGCLVVVLTCLPRDIVGFETKRLACNALFNADFPTPAGTRLYTGAAYAALLLDIGAHPVIGPVTAPQSSPNANYADDTHLTDHGYTYVAADAVGALQALGLVPSGNALLGMGFF